MKSVSELTALGRAMNDRLLELGMSGNELERRAEFGTGYISRLMRGKIPPTHPVVEKIAEVLQTDVLRLKTVAGLSTVRPYLERDRFAEYAAQELDKLLSDPAIPAWLQESVEEAVGAAIDTHRKMAEHLKQSEPRTEGEADNFDETDQAAFAMFDEYDLATAEGRQLLKEAFDLLKAEDEEKYRFLVKGLAARFARSQGDQQSSPVPKDHVEQ